MKKLINDPRDLVRELLEGTVDLSPGLALLEDENVVVRAGLPEPANRKVAVISGGGSGHEPAHAGYVGRGMLAAAVAVLMEFAVGILLILGFYTRPLAFLFALFVLGTALLGHPFWNMVDPERSANMTQFLKNLSIMGGMLLLAVSGPGRFSVDGR